MKKLFTFILTILFTGTYSQVTFKVDDVEPAKDLLKDTTLLPCLNYISNKPFEVVDTLDYNKNIVPCRNNAFVSSVYYAYADHRPLALSPDDIWNVIAQGIGIHLDHNIDEYGKKLLKEDYQKELYVRNDEMLNMTSKAWGESINNISNQLKRQCKTSSYNYFVEEFTTTTSTIKTVYRINLMYTYKKKFSYSGGSGCGIPTITLNGSIEDWQKIYDNLEKLDHYGMGFWKEELKPILKEFINAYKGDVNKEFWQGMFKEHMAYGVHNLSGWIIKFFPYIKYKDYSSEKDIDDEWMVELNYKINPYLKGERYWVSDLNMSTIPSGLTKVDFRWDILNGKGKVIEVRDMNLYGGFVGVHQDEETMTLSPVISWGVTYKDSAFEEYSYNLDIPRFKYKVDSSTLWIQKIRKKAIKPAIYITESKEDTLGRKALKNLLYDAVGTKPLVNVKITFVVTLGNTIIDLKIENVRSEDVRNKIEKTLKSTAGNWVLAKDKIHPMESRYANKLRKKLINVNAEVILEFD